MWHMPCWFALTASRNGWERLKLLRIGVDIGGTFTDFAVWRGEGEKTRALLTFKVPSTPPDFATGFRNGFEMMLERLQPEPGEPVFVMHGTTVSTNTVIERNGPPIALITTEGFRDLLELQRLRLRRPLNLYETRLKPLIPRDMVFAVPERLNGDGSERAALDLEAVRQAARAAKAAGAEGIAVAFLHSFRNPVHEIAAREAIAEIMPEMEVSLSSAIWPRIGEYERAVVCLLNTYVKTKMAAYIGEIERYLESRVPGARLFVTRSNGGAMAAEEARRAPVHTLLSGPASGVTAVQFLGRQLGRGIYLAMDMGGTSTDLSLIRDDRPSISKDAEVGDFPLVMPVTGIEAIGAGGGSIAWMDGKVLRVGPRSAGARPGPACFGHGGTQPTVSDAYVLCGYLSPTRFLGGRMVLDRAAAERAMQPIAEALGTDVTAAAEAVIMVATSNMVASVLPYLARQGVDPEDPVLTLYGGAGALHGPLLAGEVGIRRVVVPGTPSVFCAYGGLVAELVHDVVASVQGAAMMGDRLAKTFDGLEKDARAWLTAQAPAALLTGTRLEYWAEMRYRGQSFQIDVALDAEAVLRGDLTAAEAAFHAEHERLYTHADIDAPVEFVELRLRIQGALPAPGIIGAAGGGGAPEQALIERRALRIGGRMHGDCGIYAREKLAPGCAIAGPAIIEQPDATILVPPGFVAEVAAEGHITLVSQMPAASSKIGE